MRILLSFLALAALVFAGCQSPTRLTKNEAYPRIYDEQPHVIAVLPPINNSTSADAKDYYATTIAEPLNQLGYYVIPVEILNDVFEMQGLTDTEVFRDQSMRRFGETFGADAVLFTQINAWDKNYAVLSSSLEIAIDAHLKSTRSDAILWSYSGRIIADLSGQGGSSGNILADLIVQAVVTAVSTAMADYVDYARLANTNLLYSIPLGRYRDGYGQDGAVVVTFAPGTEPSLPSLEPEIETSVE